MSIVPALRDRIFFFFLVTPCISSIVFGRTNTRKSPITPPLKKNRTCIRHPASDPLYRKENIRKHKNDHLYSALPQLTPVQLWSLEITSAVSFSWICFYFNVFICDSDIQTFFLVHRKNGRNYKKTAATTTTTNNDKPTLQKSFPYAFNFSTFFVKKAGAQLALVSPIQDLVMESFVPKCSAGARMGKGTKKK